MLTVHNTEAIRQIESAIGYTFRDKRLLVQVFTRKTYMRLDPEAPDNEVLEFYGDMLMSYHVTTYFIEKFAHMLDDGLYFMRTVEQFTEMRSHYVRNQYLTERIKALLPNIDRLVRAQNPRIELPKDNQKAYADLFESLVGAVYLDSYRDDDLIRAFILRHLNIEPKEGQAATAPRSRRSTVTVLPAVSLVDRPEDGSAAAEESPEPLPRAEAGKAEGVRAEAGPAEADPTAEEPADETVTAPAEAAPIAAAEAVPEQTAPAVDPVPAEESGSATPEAAESVEPPVETDTPTAEEVPTPMRDELITYCREAGFDLPAFGEAPKNAPNARPVAACTVRYRNAKGKPVKLSLNDSGKTLPEAVERVAVKMLKKLKEQAPAPEAEKSVPTESSPAQAAPETAPVTEVLPLPEISVEATAEAPVKSEAAVAAPSEPESMNVPVTEGAYPAAVASSEDVTPAKETTPAEEAASTKETSSAKKPSRRRKAVTKKETTTEAPAETEAVPAPLPADSSANVAPVAEMPDEPPAVVPAEVPTVDSTEAAPEAPAKTKKKPARKSRARDGKTAEAEPSAEAPAETTVPVSEPVASEAPVKAGATPKKPRRRSAAKEAKEKKEPIAESAKKEL